MSIKTKIVADSINPCGQRLITYELTYPRFIHSELLTHRLLSRNSASSRAIPATKMRENILANPAMPVRWGKNQAGMQAHEDLDPNSQNAAKQIWLTALKSAAYLHKILASTGLHKQVVNRILEPWMNITVICSGTEFENFFMLRCHPDAQPEFQALACQMEELYRSNDPKPLAEGEWHLPFIEEQDRLWALEHSDQERSVLDLLLAISVGRCARVSYLTHDGIRDPIEDIALHDRLRSARPPHMSPFEHQAMSLATPTRIGNFVGWKQYRKLIPNEHADREVR